MFHMRFNFALISSFLFVSAILADRTLEHRSQLLERVELATASNPTTALYQAGGMVTLNRGIHNASARFLVPSMRNTLGAGVLISVDIGGKGPFCAHLFSAGVAIDVTENGINYTAYAYMASSDDVIEELIEFPVSFGDQMEVELGFSDEVGKVIISDLTKNQTYHCYTTNGWFCRQSAQWVTTVDPGWTPPSSYGAVTFESAMVYDDFGNAYGPQSAELFDMVDDYNHTLTDVTSNNASISIIPLNVE